MSRRGWAYVQILSVADLITGPFGSSLKKHEYVRGGVPIVNPMHISDGRIVPSEKMTVSVDTAARLKHFSLRVGDVIIGRRGEMGRCAAVTKTEDGWICGTGSLIVRPCAVVSTPYLQRFLSSPAVVQALMAASVGSTMVNLNQGIMRKLEIPVPPRAEQKRIADKLDQLVATLDTCKARLGAIPATLKRFRQSMLAAATSGKLTEEWRELYGSASAADALQQIQAARIAWAKSNPIHNEAARVLRHSVTPVLHSRERMPELPSGWVWAALGDVCHLIVDCHNKTAPYSGSGIPLIRTSNIREGRLLLSGVKFVDEPTYNYWSRRCPPQPGDIIFTREAPMAEAAIIPAEARVCLGQRTMLLRPNHACSSVQYLLIALMDEGFRARAESIAVGTGVKHLRVGDVQRLQIPLPPHAEQLEIARRVLSLTSACDAVERRVSKACADTEKLAESILAKAFRGELVPQDPNDEPADQLIARARAATECNQRQPGKRACIQQSPAAKPRMRKSA